MNGGVILITGVMAAGKSTVAQSLAERFPRSVHLRGDVFRRMIVNGQAEMGLELSDESQDQLLLRYRIAVNAAQWYAEAGFTVVYQDIILGETLREVVGWFGETPLEVVVLAPHSGAVAMRELTRNKSGYARADDISAFDRVLRDETPRIGLWLDTSEMTIEETVERILEGIA